MGPPSDNPTTSQAALRFRPPATPASASRSKSLNPIPSSSPAFATPAHPLRSANPAASHVPHKPTILPILLPPPTLRPVAFRTFTKKYDLTLTSSALSCLATFIGKHCGAGWREEGLGEKVLEEVAKTWKKNGGSVIVDGDGKDLKDILSNLEGCMAGGKIASSRAPTRQNSFASTVAGSTLSRSVSNTSGPADVQSETDLSMMSADDDEEDEDYVRDPRRWLKVVGAYEQPRLSYNAGRKHFDPITTPPSLFPPPTHKTQMFRNRYNLIHQRLLRNEAFQKPTVAPSQVPTLQRSSSTLITTQQFYKITQIANLLGRSGSTHLLLGLLTISPTGTLAITDLSGSIALDLQHAKPVPDDHACFVPGMIVLVEGIYEEEYNSNAGTLGGGGGVGGTIGGSFIGLSIGGPPCERREVTLGVTTASGPRDAPAGGGFGWVDFLGVGSVRGMGSRMRRIEQRVFTSPRAPPSSSIPSSPSSSSAPPDDVGRGRIAILGEVHLDSPRALEALRKVLSLYASEPASRTPMAIVLVGNFVQYPVMAGGSSGSGGSIEYKEYFDSLASLLSDFPTLTSTTTFIFVPGDNDPFAGAFSAGAATIIPRKPIPGVFTSRVKRAFAAANAEADRLASSKRDDLPGEAIWTTNPTRLSLFGPAQELVLFRDDISSRLRRNALRFRPPAAEDAPAEVAMVVDRSVQAAESHLPPSSSSSSSTSSPSLAARLLAKTLLDQGHLSPFPLTTRPVLWDYASALTLYPLPTALVLVDAEMDAFVVPNGGGHGQARGTWVMNPGRLMAATGRGREARWVEWDGKARTGRVRRVGF